MATTNSSYIDESSSLVELWEILDAAHIYSLLTKKGAEDEEDDLDEDLDAEQLSRLYRALNWGKQQITVVLSSQYEIDEVTKVDAPEVLKVLNAKFAEWFLERRRYRTLEECSNDIDELRKELTLYITEPNLYKLPLARKSFAVVGAVSNTTRFDNPGQFDSVMPSRDRDIPYPDSEGV